MVVLLHASVTFDFTVQWPSSAPNGRIQTTAPRERERERHAPAHLPADATISWACSTAASRTARWWSDGRVRAACSRATPCAFRRASSRCLRPRPGRGPPTGSAGTSASVRGPARQTQKRGSSKTGRQMVPEPSPESLPQGGLDILKFNKAPLIYSVSYFIFVRFWSLFGGHKPTKTPVATELGVVESLSRPRRRRRRAVFVVILVSEEKQLRLLNAGRVRSTWVFIGAGRERPELTRRVRKYRPAARASASLMKHRMTSCYCGRRKGRSGARPLDFEIWFFFKQLHSTCETSEESNHTLFEFVMIWIFDMIPCCFTCGVKLRDYRYAQVWIIAKRRKQNLISWFL